MFPSSKNIKRILIYSLYFFSNYSNILNIEKKYSFKIYNKIINHFYVLRSFSFLLNFNYFKKRNFQQIKEISFFQDHFSHWHLNLNKFSKFINTHYNEYLYNYINKHYSKKSIEKKKNLQLIKMHDKYFTSYENEMSFFTFNRLKKNENIKHIFFSKKLSLDKLNFFFNINTNLYYLNQHLVYPKSFLIASIEEEEKIKANLKKKSNLIADKTLRYSKNKIEKLMYIRKREKILKKKKIKFKKKRKKIRIFGEDEVEDFTDVEKEEV